MGTTNDTHTVGSRVWVRDDAESWIKAEVVRLDGPSSIVVKAESGRELKAKADDLPLQNPEARGVEVRRRSSSIAEDSRARGGGPFSCGARCFSPACLLGWKVAPGICPRARRT